MNQMQCALCVSRRSIPRLHHHSTENVCSIAQDVPALVGKTRSKIFSDLVAAFCLAKVFGNVMVVLMDFLKHTVHFWTDYSSGIVSCRLLCKVADCSSGP